MNKRWAGTMTSTGTPAFVFSGSLAVTGSLTITTGTITLNGAAKTVSGDGTTINGTGNLIFAGTHSCAGDFTVNGAGAVTVNGGDTGVVITNSSAPFSFTSLSTSGTARAGIYLDSNTGSFTVTRMSLRGKGLRMANWMGSFSFRATLISTSFAS